MYCCNEFSKATARGTDNEGYSCLIRFDGDEAIIGLDLTPLKFCPWCGKPFLKSSNLEVAAQKVVDLTWGKQGDWDNLKDAILEMANILEKKEKP